MLVKIIVFIVALIIVINYIKNPLFWFVRLKIFFISPISRSKESDFLQESIFSNWMVFENIKIFSSKKKYGNPANFTISSIFLQKRYLRWINLYPNFNSLLRSNYKTLIKILFLSVNFEDLQFKNEEHFTLTLSSFNLKIS